MRKIGASIEEVNGKKEWPGDPGIDAIIKSLEERKKKHNTNILLPRANRPSARKTLMFGGRLGGGKRNSKKHNPVGKKSP